MALDGTTYQSFGHISFSQRNPIQDLQYSNQVRNPQSDISAIRLYDSGSASGYTTKDGSYFACHPKDSSTTIEMEANPDFSNIRKEKRSRLGLATGSQTQPLQGIDARKTDHDPLQGLLTANECGLSVSSDEQVNLTLCHILRPSEGHETNMVETGSVSAPEGALHNDSRECATHGTDIPQYASVRICNNRYVSESPQPDIIASTLSLRSQSELQVFNLIQPVPSNIPASSALGSDAIRIDRPQNQITRKSSIGYCILFV